MGPYTIWHNSRCSKSRQALGYLQEKGVDVKIIKYLESPPTQKELGDVLDLLKQDPRDLMRKNEKEYKELNLDNAALSRDDLIEAMVNHPILIERPVVIYNNQAIVGRPPEKVIDFITS